MTREYRQVTDKKSISPPPTLSSQEEVAIGAPYTCKTCPPQSTNPQTPLDTCLESPKILLNALKAGRLRGMVCIVGDDAAESSTQFQSLYASLIRELLQRDILVLASDCTIDSAAAVGFTEEEAYNAAGDGLNESCDNLDLEPVMNFGPCSASTHIAEIWSTLAEHALLDSKELPIAFVVPTEKEAPQAVCAEFSLSASLAPSTPHAAIMTADQIEAHIHSQRLRLSWCDRYHCTIHS